VTDESPITFTATEWRGTVLPQPLDFPPPYVENAKDQEGFSYWWQLIKYVFDLPDPHLFPPLSGFSAEERIVLLRYVAMCRELAESTVLSYEGGIEFKTKNGNVTFTADEPPREAIRGTVVLFRQLASDDERASYSTVRKIIGRRIHEVVDEHSGQRDEWQRRWNRARAALMSGMLTAMADRKVIDSMGGSRDVPVPGEDVRPTELISLFQYGDLIHWDKQREAMGALVADDFMHKFRTLQFLEVIIQLSHVYLGYSILVRRALDLPTEVGT